MLITKIGNVILVYILDSVKPKCESYEDCNDAIIGSFCIDGQCRCEEGVEYEGKCFKCESSEDCNDALPGSSCMYPAGQCRCRTGWKEYEGSCIYGKHVHNKSRAF